MKRLNLLLYYVFLLFTLVGTSVNASDQCQYANKGKLNNTHVYHRDEFSIYYDLEGEAALLYQQDHNANEVPDVVEDIMTQLIVARRLFTEVLGFRHPLKQPRYEGVGGIRIRLADTGTAKGKAFDEPHRFPDQRATGSCSLLIKMSHRLEGTSYTPVHELFHLFQYGYTPFKTRWFLEGTARWSESLLNNQSLKPERLPTAEELPLFFTKSYEAGRVWQSLALDIDPEGLLNLPNDIAEIRFTDGRLVVADKHLHGALFMRRVLEGFTDYGYSVSQSLSIDPYHWDEKLQTDKIYDHDLWKIVMHTFNLMKGD